MTDIIRLRLTDQQREQLAPLAGEAARDGQNVLFVATVVPFWDKDEGAVIWRLEVIRIKATAGGKVKKAILAAAS